jgi:hypothetical protein
MKVRTVIIGRKALIFTIVSSIGLGLIVGYFLSIREGAHLAQAIIADLNCTCGCGRQLDPCEFGRSKGKRMVIIKNGLSYQFYVGEFL